MFLESRTTCHIKIITDQYHPVKKGVKVSSLIKDESHWNPYLQLVQKIDDGLLCTVTQSARPVNVKISFILGYKQ